MSIDQDAAELVTEVFERNHNGISCKYVRRQTSIDLRSLYVSSGQLHILGNKQGSKNLRYTRSIAK